MLLLKYIYFCFYIILKYLIIHDHADLIQHFDALHACCSNDLFIKYLYVNHKIYILFADNVFNVHLLHDNVDDFLLEQTFSIFLSINNNDYDDFYEVVCINDFRFFDDELKYLII